VTDHSPGPSVIIILGSPADRTWADRIEEALVRFGIEPEVKVASAHKTPEYLIQLLRAWEAQPQAHVYVTVAGRSNALSAFVDAQVVSPVIACPPSSEAFGGMDIISSLRMPRGVAPLVVLEPENAALAAAKILGVSCQSLREGVARSQDAERQRVTSGGPS
jgi:5-(carboxyamino)imidazole ribonucleotide mutase